MSNEAFTKDEIADLVPLARQAVSGETDWDKLADFFHPAPEPKEKQAEPVIEAR